MAGPWREVAPPIWKRLAVLGAIGGVLAAMMLWALVRWANGPGSWGDPTGTVTSPDGRFELVTYQFDAMIDPGWVVALERTDSRDREWVWRSVEHVAPTSVFFDGDAVVVRGSDGNRYETEFDPETLEPVDRYCLRVEYCYDSPWTEYTRTSARPPA